MADTRSPACPSRNPTPERWEGGAIAARPRAAPDVVIVIVVIVAVVIVIVVIVIVIVVVVVVIAIVIVIVIVIIALSGQTFGRLGAVLVPSVRFL